MYDYPHFDGTQTCQNPSPSAALAFSGAVGADPVPALVLCAACPFMGECRDWALTHDVYGVWGGTSEEDRSQIRAQAELPDPSSITDQLDDLVIAMRNTHLADEDPNLAAAS